MCHNQLIFKKIEHETLKNIKTNRLVIGDTHPSKLQNNVINLRIITGSDPVPKKIKSPSKQCTSSTQSKTPESIKKNKRGLFHKTIKSDRLKSAENTKVINCGAKKITTKWETAKCVVHKSSETPSHSAASRAIHSVEKNRLLIE